MAVSDPVVMPLARDLLACLAQEIGKVTKPPKYVQLRAGTIVDHLMSTGQDECCDGLAWVRPAGFYPSSVFPTQDEAPTMVRKVGAPLAWAITLELGAIRCAPVGNEHNIPSEDDWDTTVQAVMDDAAAMRRALCCLQEIHPRRSMVFGLWQPVAVQGGCTGGVIQVTVRGPACDCSEAGPA